MELLADFEPREANKFQHSERSENRNFISLCLAIDFYHLVDQERLFRKVFYASKTRNHNQADRTSVLALFTSIVSDFNLFLLFIPRQ
jgi:hypothetical protein